MNAAEMPVRHELFQNHPNPFNAVTTIRYALAEAETVTLTVFDPLGGRVLNLIKDVETPPGYHYIVWDGRDSAGRPVSSGVYFVRMETETLTATRSISVVR